MVIKCSSLCRKSGKKNILSDIHFEIKKASFCSVIGAGDAGKTTLLRIINGELAPNSGEVRIFGKPPHKIKHKISILDENRLAFNCLKGIDYAETYQNIYKNWNVKIFKEICNQNHFDLKKKIGSCSMEEKTILFSALLLASRAPLMLLDEPFRFVKTPFKDYILKKLKDFVCKKQCTVFCASHEDNGLEKVTDKLIIMKKGQMVFSDSLESALKEHRLAETFSAAKENERIGPVLSKMLYRTNKIDGEIPTMKELISGYLNRNYPD